MSAEMVARWNAIPMTRPDPEQGSSRNTLKRRREDGQDEDMGMNVDGEESDDNVSLVSRTPSPPPPESMDVDKYDEYIRGRVAPEVISVETKIKSTNKGFAMLARLGWSEGQPLGTTGDGRVEPIPFHVKRDLTGLGKTSQDVRMIETTVSQRRGLDSERQQKETEEQRRQREDHVARRTAVQEQISETLRAFYCSVCEKQFQNVAQYDEHTNSYAHHHKVRFRDMQAAQRQKQNTQEEIERRKEKERKREEKQLRKIAAAAGVKVAKPAAIVSTPALAPTTDQPSMGVKASGWATVSGGPSAEPAPKTGWAPVAAPAPPAPPRTAGGSVSVQSAPPPPPAAPSPVRDAHLPPAFRTGGWSSLDTTSRTPPPAAPLPTGPLPAAVTPSSGGWASHPPPPVASSAVLPPQAVASSGGWSRQLPPPEDTSMRASAPRRGWDVGPVPPQPPTEAGRPPFAQPPYAPPQPASSVGPQPSSFAQPSYAPPPSAAPVAPQAVLAPVPPSQPPAKAPSKQDDKREKGRSGWQTFQRGGRRK